MKVFPHKYNIHKQKSNFILITVRSQMYELSVLYMLSSMIRLLIRCIFFVYFNFKRLFPGK